MTRCGLHTMICITTAISGYFHLSTESKQEGEYQSRKVVLILHLYANKTPHGFQHDPCGRRGKMKKRLKEL